MDTINNESAYFEFALVYEPESPELYGADTWQLPDKTCRRQVTYAPTSDKMPSKYLPPYVGIIRLATQIK